MSKKILASQSPGDKYFLYVGNAYPHKNLNRLIEAIVLLNRKTDEKVLLKMSSARNVFVDRLRASIENLGARDYVELLGFVPDKDLPTLYKQSIAFIFPSLSEGFGLPGLEAMEAGALVLASDIPVFSEVYQNHVAYFDPLSVESIAKTMKKALELSSDEKEKIIRESQLFAKRYSWAKMAKETLKIYTEVL
jgi:glycosyltransferase involved in cell wall biosynthesis